MAIRFSELRLWIVAWLYALWLNGLTYVFYLTEGSASTELESALLLGSIPVIVQIWLLGIDKRGWQTGILFSLLFVLAILLSYVGNIESWMMWVFFFNIIFVFIVGMIISACPNSRIITSTAASYAVLGAILLLMGNLTEDYNISRLTSGLHPNFWGLIAASVAASSFAFRSRTLGVICWIVVLMTLYNASARGSMLAVLAGLSGVVWYSLLSTRKPMMATVLLGMAANLLVFVIILNLLPQITTFIWQDLLKTNDPYRGLGTGFTGRATVWFEALNIWLEAPFFGVGFRQHESLLTTASSTHNGYLAMLIDTGILGLVVYVTFIGYSLHATLRAITDPRTKRVILAIIVTYLVMALFDRRALNAGNAFSIWFIIACFYALRARARKLYRYRLAGGPEKPPPPQGLSTTPDPPQRPA
jgi:hypothetical protein